MDTAIGFLRVPEGKTAKNRMHIDIRVAGEPPWDMTSASSLSVRRQRSWLPPGLRLSARSPTVHLGHVVMLDPEGNEFCVA